VIPSTWIDIAADLAAAIADVDRAAAKHHDNATI
jgi:hypothetical protein